MNEMQRNSELIDRLCKYRESQRVKKELDEYRQKRLMERLREIEPQKI